MKFEKEELTKTIDFYNQIFEDKYESYKAWEFCYIKFWKYKKSDIHRAALYIVQYLAAYGMMRGSGVLMSKNYRIFIPIIKLLQKKEYADLRGISSKDLNSKNIILIWNLKEKLSKTLTEIIKFNKKGNPFKPSDTLITKILLGTLGCTPAYDNYFMKGLRVANSDYTTFSKKSLVEINQRISKRLINHFRNKLRCETNIIYPDMRLIDMYFWYLGAPQKSRVF